MTEQQYQYLYNLNKKINDGTSSKEDKEDYVKVLRDTNIITQEQYNNYESQTDNNNLFKAILLVGAFALVAYLVSKSSE
ncbi:hypothetical protein [Capnocytophaga sputigena]|uniref:hypothetical protein n=1 Tax=Capnocytophaga sputigena TaxID=1019 RepID=UPI0028D76C46|nr:hypothetical protein [Capnocytophaga sputigena]